MDVLKDDGTEKKFVEMMKKIANDRDPGKTHECNPIYSVLYIRNYWKASKYGHVSLKSLFSLKNTRFKPIYFTKENCRIFPT